MTARANEARQQCDKRLAIEARGKEIRRAEQGEAENEHMKHGQSKTKHVSKTPRPEDHGQGHHNTEKHRFGLLKQARRKLVTA